MEFDAGSLMLSFLISGIGFVFFSYGRKMQRLPQVAAGLSLMVYPYFTSGIWWTLAVAIGILITLWILLWQGL